MSHILILLICYMEICLDMLFFLVVRLPYRTPRRALNMNIGPEYQSTKREKLDHYLFCQLAVKVA